MFRFKLPAMSRGNNVTPGEELQRRLPGASAMHLDSCDTLAGIFVLLQQRQDVPLRDLHRKLDKGQSVTLRAVHELQSHGYIVMSEDLHDPLAAHITLTPTTQRRIARLLAP